jgi:predicted nucleic acid-binding protein
MFLLDTNVVSELRKIRTDRVDSNVASWVRSVPVTSLYLSVVVVQELETGVLLAERRDARQGATLRAWMEDGVMALFADRVLPVDVAVARQAAALGVPDPRPFRDGLIAATALVHRMTVVTRNLADFGPTGVPLLDPWQARS